jgi:hypothetical protein
LSFRYPHLAVVAHGSTGDRAERQVRSHGGERLTRSTTPEITDFNDNLQESGEPFAECHVSWSAKRQETGK